MTRDEAAAHVLLTDEAADADIDELLAECVDGALRGYHERVFMLRVGLRCDAGSEFPAEVVTDLETGRRIIEAARAIIIQRRLELGVEKST